MSVTQQATIASQFRIPPDQMPTIPTATMAPNYTAIKKFQDALEYNAMAIQSYQSKLGHLSLVISEEEYLSANNNTA